MANNFEATVKLITEVDYSSIDKINPNAVAKKLSKAYGPITKQLFRDPFIGLSKEYAKANLKFYDKSKMKSFAKDMQSEYAKAAVSLSDAQSKLEKNAGDSLAKAQQSTAMKEMKSIENNYKNKLKKEEEILSYRKDALERVDQKSQESWSATAKRWGSSILDAGSAVASGSDDPLALAQSTYGAVESQAQEIEVKGLEESASMMEEAAGSFAESTKTFAAAGTAGLVAGLALLVKGIMAAMDYGMEMNQIFLEGSSAIDLGASNAQELSKNLQTVRQASEDLGLVVNFRTSAKENARILSLLNQQGVTYKKLAGDINDADKAQRNYVKAIEQAYTYSKLLGVSLEEVTEMQGTLINDLGYTVENADEAFRSLAKGAEISGFNVKRFYSMVLQSTSGMAAHNVRIEEASALLATFAKALGKNAEAMFQAFTKGFSEEGMTDRFKRIMVTGGKNMKEIFGDASERVAGKFFDDFKGQGDKLKVAFSKAGIDVKDMNIKTPEGQKEVIKKLSKLDPKAQAKLVEQVRSESGDAAARQMGKLVDLSKGTSGQLGDMAKSLGKLDFTGNFVASLKSANGVLKTPLHEMSAMQIAAFEQITGISGEQREMLSEVSRMLHGQKAILDDQLKQATKDGKISQEKQAELAKQYGATVVKTEKGWKIMAATTQEVNKDGTKSLEAVISDSEIKNAEDLAAANEKSFSKLVEKPMTEEIQLAKAMVRETTKLSSIMEGGIQAILGQIYDGILAVIDLMPGNSLTAKEKENRRIALDTLSEQKNTLMEQKLATEKEIAALEEQAKEATGEEETGIRDLIGLMKSQKDLIDKNLQDNDAASTNLMNRVSGGVTNYGLGKSGKSLTPDELLAGAHEGEGLGVFDTVAGAASNFQKENKGVIGSVVGPTVETGLGMIFDKLSGLDEDGNKDPTKEGLESVDGSIEGLAAQGDKLAKDKEKLDKDHAKKTMAKQEDIIDAILETQKNKFRMAVAELGGQLGLNGAEQEAALDSLIENGKLPAHIIKNMSKEQQEAFKENVGVNDFIVNSQGITPINRKDQVVGYKPGGPIDQALGGKGGNTNNITINVYGAGKAAVLTALKELGLTN